MSHSENREQKAREAKEKHNAEHPEYRYKPTSKSTPRKPRPRKPQVADEDLTEDQLRERRRCEVVAKVILQKKNSPAPPQESNELPSLAALQGGASGTATPEASRASSAPPADDIKARLATEMKKAVEEDRQRREWEEEQRSLGLLPPRPTEPRSRRQRAATVALESSRRAPSAPPIPSPIRAASMDPVYTPGFSGHEHFFRQQQQHHHHRASSWSGSHLLQPFNSDPTDFQFESSYQPYHEESARYEPYSGAEAQWDIRRPSVIFRDVSVPCCFFFFEAC